MKYLATIITFFIVLHNCSAQQSAKVEAGVSLALAEQRRAMITDIQYTLNFTIPAIKNELISGQETLTFKLKSVPDLFQIDFKQEASFVKQLTVNGKNVAVLLKDEHLLVPKENLRTGTNKLEIVFTAGNESLNRNDEYLYALFVPDHARSAFPCFDQPDLKAKFLLTLTVPQGWKALANGKLKDSTASNAQTTYRFKNSDLLPTYLFSFTAGKYSSVNQSIAKRNYEFLHRETDPKKLTFSTDSIFQAHADAINFLEDWTKIDFPFQKVGLVAIPDFQFGGMEHPGEVQYKASSLFLDESATKDQFIARSNLISHETAHMWFGDLVTMRWFNDVWMKEVFANFMADKVTEKMMGTSTFNLKFLQDHYPAAYGVDRTLGANPIRQELDNLQDAGSMYGNIIYHKAPIMMRQLELLMGKEDFRNGIREYLKKYSYTNATWNELIAILAKHTKADLYEWNKVWVNLPGRPVIDYQLNYNGDKISSLKLTQQAEVKSQNTWPQSFTITLVYDNQQKDLKIDMKGAELVVTAAEGLKKPQYLLFNSDAMGYGLFPTDERMATKMYQLENPLQRASAYLNAYESMLAGKSFRPLELVNLFASGIGLERNEMNLKMLTGYINTIYWNFLLPQDRLKISLRLEELLWSSLQKETLTNNKKILFKTFQEIYLSAAANEKIYQIWKTQVAPTGMRLAEDDYISLALTLALKAEKPTTVIADQRERVTNIERKNRLTFLAPALSLDENERDHFFKSLKDRSNRTKESWVISALAYLNHPLRHNTSINYLPASLELLEEIKKTGDIFFPQSWLGAIFGSYQSKEAYQIVQDFLKAHPNYDPKLKGKILQATDNLRRAREIL